MTSDKAVWVGEMGNFFSFNNRMSSRRSSHVNDVICIKLRDKDQQRLEKVCLVMPFLVFYKTYITVLLIKLQQRGILEFFFLKLNSLPCFRFQNAYPTDSKQS